MMLCKNRGLNIAQQNIIGLMHKYRHSQPESTKNKLELDFKVELPERSQPKTPPISRINFQRRSGPYPNNHSGPEIPKLHNLHMQHERKHNISALFPHQISSRYENHSEKKQQDSNTSYLKQIDALSSKKRARHYFLRQREASRIETNPPPLNAIDRSKQFQESPRHERQAVSKLIQKRPQQEQNIQQMHYHMVRNQQLYKQMVKK